MVARTLPVWHHSMLSNNMLSMSHDEVPIHYDVQGNGSTALVFVHGWCCNRGYWERQVRRFASQYMVATVDLAGHGESGPNRTTWAVSDFGKDVIAVIEQLLPPVRNLSKITTLEVVQGALRTQWCIDALSKKKAKMFQIC